MATQAQQTIWFRVAAILAGLLISTFGAWAAVVWSASQDLRSLTALTSSDIRALTVVVKGIQHNYEDLKFIHSEHERRDWHSAAGLRLQALQSQIDHLEARIKERSAARNGP